MNSNFDQAKNSFLLARTYPCTKDGIEPYRPTTKEVLLEFVDTVNFIGQPRRWLNALMLAAHVATLGCLVAFFTFYLRVDTFLFWLGSTLFLCNGPHTMWYHRYCAHRCMKFKNRQLTRLFLWTNPLYTLEEHYAIAHRQHHVYQETLGDPYGPHIGWLASYFAIDSIQKLNVDISPERYEQLRKSIDHIGFRANSYAQFQRTGTVEHLGHYFARLFVAQTLWCSFAYVLGGVPYVVAWYGATYTLWFLLRDFGWRGHRGKVKRPGWEFDPTSSATNQRFYGHLASEWHDNHHQYPNSANLGFLPSQTDVSFWFVRILHALGIVESYHDAKPRFLKRHPQSGQQRQSDQEPSPGQPSHVTPT